MTGIDFSLINHSITVLESSGVLWAFASASGNRFVCRYSIDGGKKWSADETLVFNFSGEFNLTFDTKDNIHLACIDTQGQLFYLNWQGEQWNKRIIPLKALAKSVSISIYKDSVHLVYLTFSKSDKHTWSLEHTQFDPIGKCEEKTISSGDGHYLNKGVSCCDNEGNLHLVYRVYDSDRYNLFYTCLSNLGGSWQSPRSMGVHVDNTSPCLMSDDHGDIHLLYTVSDGKNLRAAYVKKQRQAGWLMPDWSIPFYISLEGHNAYSPTMIIKDKQILALWQQIDGIYRRLSVDLGLNWSKVYKDHNFEDIVSLTPYNHDNIKNNYKMSSFGSTTSGLNLIAASHFSKEEFFSPSPTEIGNHLILPLDDKMIYLPKSMQLFVSLLNNHLQKIVLKMAQEKNREDENTNIPFKVNYSNVLKELASLRVQLEEARNQVKQIDSLQDHAKSLSSKLFEMHGELKEKEAQIDQYKKVAQKPIEVALPEATCETLPEPDSTPMEVEPQETLVEPKETLNVEKTSTVIPLIPKEQKTSKEFKININFR